MSSLPPIVPIALSALLGRLGAEELGIGFQAGVLVAALLVWRGRVRGRGLGIAVALGALTVLPGSGDGAPGMPREAGLLRFRGTMLTSPREASFGQRVAWVRVGRQELRIRFDRGRGRLPGRGDRIEASGWFRPAARGGSIRVGKLRVLPAPFTPARLRNEVLRHAESVFARRLERRSATLLGRLVLGKGGGIGSRDSRNHRRLGLSHLLAISGLHTVFLASLLCLLLGPLVRPGRSLLPWLVVLLVSYAWLTGFRPPVTRAVVGFLLWRWCREKGRPFALASALSLAGLWTIALFPGDLGSPSFCLSYLATVGLVWLTPLFTPQRIRHPLLRWYLLATAASLAAQLSVAALGFEYFGCIGPWGILLTPLALPAVMALLCLGICLPVLEPLLPALAGLVATLVDALAAGYLSSLDALAGLPAAPLHPLGVSPEGLVPAILALGSLLAFSTRKRTVFLGTVLCAMLAWLVPWPEKPGRSFRLLRVGHGQSALFLEPGRSLAFDCGDSVGGGRAARRLCEALRQAGRSRLDHLILSHGDHDHASGLPELCLRVAIGRVWLPESPKCGAWVRLLRRHGIPFRVIPPGSELSPLDGCRILYPHEEGDLAGSNDGALVLHYRFPDGPRILVTGDQEDAGILACVSRLRRMRDPGSDIVVLPHHGRSRRFLGELLEITRPEFCLASTSLTGGLAGVPRGRLLTTATAGDLVLEQARDGRYYLEGKARVGR